MAKSRKGYDRKEPGQQFEEIEAAQRKLGHDEINSIQGSKQADKQELKQLGEEELDALSKKAKTRPGKR